MKKVRILSALLIILIAVSALAGCGGTKANPPIKIGLVAPLTGPSGGMGQSQERGYRLAMEEINGKGGVNGRLIEIETYDDQGDPQKAASGAQKFVDDKSIVAVGGSCNSSSTLAMSPIIDAGKLPNLVVTSSSPKLTGSSEYFFRMSVQDASVGPQMADVLLSLGHKTVAIMFPNNDYGKGLSEALANRMKEKGGEVLESLTYQADDQDFSAQLTTIKNLKPDIIALTGTQQDSGLIIKQIDQMGLGIPIIGGTGLYNVKTLEVSGKEAAEGVILIGVYVATNPDPKVQELVGKYKKKYDQTPDGFAALAYDQMYVIAAAATKAMSANKGNLTRDGLKDALKTTDYVGCTGHVKFNEVNDWVRPYLTLVVKNGEFVMFTP